MNLERYNFLTSNQNAVLTPQEWNQGWHWCNEWDGMLVGPNMHEALVCSCNHPVIEEWKKTPEAKQKMDSHLAMDRLSKLDEELGLS